MVRHTLKIMQQMLKMLQCIIIGHAFPENFIEIPQGLKKTFSVNISYFHHFFTLNLL